VKEKAWALHSLSHKEAKVLADRKCPVLAGGLRRGFPAAAQLELEAAV